MDRLKSIGLNSYERKLWIALLSRGTATAGALSQIAGVPRSRAYDVLESLAEKGFVIVQTTKPLKYVAVEPKDAFERLKVKIHKDFKSMVKRVDKLKETEIMDELQTLHKEGLKITEPGELTGTLKGDVLTRHFKSMIKGATKDISILTTAEGLKNIYRMYSNALREATTKGVKVRIAVPEVPEHVIEKMGDIAEIRKISPGEITGRFAIVDGREMLMNVTHDKEVHPTQDVAIWTHSKHAVGEMMQPLFEMLWGKIEAG
jgi:sugar-specific transcriptional regulator TrmB